jgi:hypothetical protein
MSTPFSISFPEILSLYLNDIPLLSFLVSMNVSRTTSRPRSTWGEKLANMDFFSFFLFVVFSRQTHSVLHHQQEQAERMMKSNNGK